MSKPKTLKQLRHDKGLTLVQVAEKLEVSYDTVRRWEAGWTFPTAPDIVKICKLYNTNFDKITFEVSKDK